MPERDVIIRIKATNLSKPEIDKARRQLDGLEKKAGAASKKFGPLSKEVQRLSQNFAQMNPLTSTASRLFGGANVAALGAAGAIAGLGLAIGASAKHVISLGVELTTLRDKTKLSLDFLQDMRFVADQLNIGFDQVTQSVIRLGRRTGADLPATRKAIEGLGLSMDDIISMNPEKQFLLIVDALSKIENTSLQNAAAMDVFGDAGLQVLPLIRNDVQALVDEFDSLNGKIDKEILESARRFDDSMTSLKTTVSGLAGEIAGPLVDSLADATEKLVEFIKRRNELDQRAERSERDPVLEQLLEQRDEAAPRFDFLFGPQKGDPEALAAIEKQIVLRQEVLDQVERLEESIASGNQEIEVGNDFLGTANEKARTLAQIEATRAKLLSPIVKLQQQNADWIDEAAFNTGVLADEAARADETFIQIGGVVGGVIPRGIKGIGDLADEAADGIHDAVIGVGDLDSATAKAEEGADRYSDAIADLAHQFQILGIDANSTLGSMIANFSTLAVQIPKLKEEFKKGGVFGVGGAIGDGDAVGAATGVAAGIGGIASATSRGSTGARTGAGALAGASAGAQVGGPIGAIVGAAAGAITGFLRGRGATKALEAIENEVGLRVSEGLLDAIRDSGRPAQLMIAEIFSEGIAAGTASADDLARETADVFSFLERGDITESEAIRALEKAVPLLLQNFRDLGPAGEEEIRRITAAAPAMRCELAELGELADEEAAA